MVRQFLYADPTVCVGCRICEAICSLHWEKTINPKKARNRVRRVDPGLDVVVACRNCDQAWCIEACPEDAIRRNRKGIVIVDTKKCRGCGACVEACPFGAIFLHPDTQKAIKCVTCGFCTKYCPVDTLRIVTNEQLAALKQEKVIQYECRDLLDDLRVDEESETGDK
ncbi:MAG: 4Fe-4S dicluster domain-containing protein [Candidatus Thorarchaeota archaeon]